MNKLRKLEKNDFNKNILDLLSQLTHSPSIKEEELNNFIDNLNEYHQIWVIERNNKIIAIGTLLIEKKLIHNLGLVGHIEDIVVDKNHRGQKLGNLIINLLKYIAKDVGCYKVILNCNEKVVGFYQKLGFELKGKQLAIYFN
jgi:glucosamine-phosphate N-acetyltransferase